MNSSSPCKDEAFTLTELLVVIATVSVLILLPVTALAVSKSASSRLQCVSNLKEVGLAFRLWANNHADRFPMRVSARDAGPSFQGPTSTSTYAGANGNPPSQLWTMFDCMSNELSTPKILYCPAEYDSTVTQATTWKDSDAATVDFDGNDNLGYFVGLDVNHAKPRMLLAGDHNMGPGVAQQNTSAPVTPQIWGNAGASFVVSSQIGNATQTNINLTTAAWADNGHKKQGNFVFTDGSLQQVNTAKLREAFSKTGDTSNPHNRLVFP